MNNLNNIEQIIKTKGLKINFIVLQANVSRSQFFDIRKGNINPSLSTAIRIAKALGTTLDGIFPMNE